MHKTDSELLQGMCDGSVESFEQMYRRHGDRLFKSALSRLQDSLAAEEVVSDCFLILWKKKSSLTLHATESIYPWLFVTCRNLCFQISRKGIAEHQHLQVLAHEVASEERLRSYPNFEELEFEDLYVEISKLSTFDQEVIHLRYVENFSNTEIAQILNLSEAATRTRISRALNRVRKQMSGKLAAKRFRYQADPVGDE